MEEKTFIHFCDECQTEREFDIIDLQETFTIKGVELTATHKYEQCKNCEELFELHNDIDRNIKEDYRLYREHEHLLQTDEIIYIRKNYDISQRKFAEILGISHSTLSKIENGALQTKYQNTLFVLASEPLGFKKLLKLNKDLFTEKDYIAIKDRIDELCLFSYDKIKEISEEIYKMNIRQFEIVNDLIRRFNNLEFDYGKK